MHEFVRYILPSFLFGLACGSAFLPISFGQNMLWKKASQEGVTKARAVALYVAMFIGGLLYLAAFVAFMLTCIRFIISDDDPAVFVWLVTTVVTLIGECKMKWFRSVPNSYRQFVYEKPPAN
jgi:hypothetical protein